CHASASVTAGLKCPPEIGPNVRMRATSAAPVARVLAKRAIAVLPAASRSPIIPEPTTAASNIAVPVASATTRFGNGWFTRDSCRRCSTAFGGGVHHNRVARADLRTTFARCSLSQIVFEYNEHFPLVAVRVSHPGLVL